MRPSWIIRSVFLLCTILLCGCAGVGAQVAATERYQYNLAMQRAEDQQLLLNLVRLRYRDRPYFLETSSLATQFSIGRDIGLVGAIGSPSVQEDLLLIGGVGLEANPTLTYVPLQGEDFALRMLRPIPFEDIVLLSNSGWSIERLLRLFVQGINEVVNAPTATGPTPDNAPEYETFLSVSRLLRVMQQARQTALGVDAVTGKPVLHISRDGAATDEFAEFTRLLSLDSSRRRFGLECNQADRAANICIQMRSMTGVLNFVSQAVAISEADQAAGRVTLTKDNEGRLFDWRQVTVDLFRTEVADEKPDNAAVSVQYRDRWFYVEDNDLQSKSTLMLIGQLFSLVAVEGKTDAPVLTLPLGK